MTLLETITVSAETELRAIERADITVFWELIDRNRAHLSRWFPWAETASYESTRLFLEEQRVRHARGVDAAYGIWHRDRLAGSIGLRNLEQPSAANVGYYLDEFALGRGLMTTSLRALAEAGFVSLGIHRVELVAAIGNLASRRGAERAGVQFEGIARSRVIARGELHDAAVYARLATDV